MAYQTGIATHHRNLIEKIRSFAVLNGWTQDGSNVDIDTASVEHSTSIVMHSGTNFIRLFAYSTLVSVAKEGIRLFYGSGAAGSTLSGSSDYAQISSVTSPIQEYHLFVTSQYIHCAFKNSSGSWSHLMAGTLNKVCSFVGGHYVAGTDLNQYSANIPSGLQNNYPFCSSKSSFLQEDAWGCTRISYTEVNVLKQASMYTSTQGVAAKGVGGYIEQGVIYNHSTPQTANFSTRPQALLGVRGHSGFNNRTMLHPMMCGVGDPTAYVTWLGHPADLRFTNMSATNPKDIITLGTDQWMVFPLVSKQDLGYTDGYSENIGIAYLKSA